MAHPSSTIEPMGIWSTSRRVVFDQSISGAQNVTLSQACGALEAIIWRIDELAKLVEFLPQLYPHPQIPQVLSELFFHQGVVSSIMFNGSPKEINRESERYFAHRIEAFEYCKKYCDEAGVVPTILSSRKYRNQITHIDDYLLKAMARPNTGICVDSALHQRDMFEVSGNASVDIVFCRSYIVTEQVLIHLDNEVSIKDLREECVAVMRAVFGSEPSALPQ